MDDKSGKGAVAEDLPCHLLYLIGRYGIYLCKQAVNILLAAIVEEALAEVYGKALIVVACYAQLPLYLPLCRRQPTCRQWLRGISAQLTTYKGDTPVDIVRVATEIDTPHASVAIAHHGALYRLDQSVPLTEDDVKPRIHARSSNDVVEQIKGHSLRVASGISPVAHHDMRLMGFMMKDGLGGRQCQF